MLEGRFCYLFMSLQYVLASLDMGIQQGTFTSVKDTNEVEIREGCFSISQNILVFKN